MKKLLLACMMALGIGATAQITVSESFEGTSLPTGWASTKTGTGTSSLPSGYGASAGAACTGTKAVYKNLYAATYTGWDLTYSSTESNATDLTYSFKYLAKGFSTTGIIEGTVAADYSIDGGATWVDILSPVTISSPNATPIPCTTVSGVIPAGTIPTGADFRFRLKSTSSATADFYMGFDDVVLSQSSTVPPACTTITAPANAATGLSVTPTITWSTAAGANAYEIAIGTTAGGSDIMPLTDVGNVTSYTVPATSALSYNTQYYVTVYPKNGIGSASGCTSNSFTTTSTVPCPTVTAPTTAQSGVSLTPTFTWNAGNSSVTGYTISIGTTSGGTDIMNNVNVGNVTSYTYSGTPALSNSTTYYYTVNAISGSYTSASCTVRNFTTICTAGTTFSENFDSVAAGVWPACWSKVGTGGSANTQASAVMSGPNNLYIYSGSSTSQAVVSMPPVTTLQTDQYRLKFNGRANFTAGGVVEIGFLANPTDASTFSLLGTYTASSTSTIDSFVLNIAGVPAGIERLAFRHTGSPANSVLIDNVVYEMIPTCGEPTSVQTTGNTTSSISIEWNAPPTIPSQGYEITATNIATSAVHNFTALSTDFAATLTGLSHSSSYNICIRSKCAGTDVSPWVCYTANTACGAIAPAYSQNFTATPNCWVVGAGGDPTTGPTPGATMSFNWGTIPFLNTGTNNGFAINLYDVNRSGWLTTPSFNLNGSYELSFNYGVTTYSGTGSSAMGSDDVINLLMSTDDGATWTVVNTWNASTPITNTSNLYTYTIPPTVSSTVKFALYGADGPVNDSEDYYFHVDNFAISSALATTEVVSEKVVSVYPNPFTDILNISDVREVASVSITDMAGRMVKAIAKPTAQLQLGDLKSGLYLVTLKYKDGSVKTVKTIKK